MKEHGCGTTGGFKNFTHLSDSGRQLLSPKGALAKPCNAVIMASHGIVIVFNMGTSQVAPKKNRFREMFLPTKAQTSVHTMNQLCENKLICQSYRLFVDYERGHNKLS